MRRIPLKHHWRRVRDYVRYDLKEIAFPSALPDPPYLQTKKRRKLTFHDHVEVWKKACHLYVQSWRTGDIDIDGENDGKERPEKEKSAQELTMMEDLVMSAKLGAENIRPALQRIYMTKAAAYRDVLKSFIQGYQEGLSEEMTANGSSSSPERTNNQANISKKKLEDPKHGT
eukprot:c26834_g1_i1 orf=316-831(-)